MLALAVLGGTIGLVQLAGGQQPDLGTVGAADGSARVPTAQRVRPAGESLLYEGRPVDMVLSPDGTRLLVKDDDGLVVIDAAGWKVVQRLGVPKAGTSVHGIAASGDGRRVYVTDAERGIHEAAVDEAGAWAWKRVIDVPGPGRRGYSFPCGVALSADGATAYVCLSRNNELAVVDLGSGTVRAKVEVGVAPYAVVLGPGEKRAYVSNWGGRRAREGDRVAPSSGTPVVVDERGVAASGTVSVVDLGAAMVVAETEVGLHPSGMAVSPDGSAVLVACANSDRVTAIDAASGTVTGTLDCRPDPTLPLGSSPEALAFAQGGKTLLVADSGDNALAVFEVGAGLGQAKLRGLIPTAWYPGAIAVRGGTVFVANVKGMGSRADKPGESKKVQSSLGVIGRMSIPGEAELKALTARAKEDARLTEAARDQAGAGSNGASPPLPAPVPTVTGQASVFKHVVYLIKENRTFDQVYGDMGKGNADPSLCLYGQEVTPNQHALASEFALLDNFYCNGVKSTDGHAWVCEGNAVDYIERQFGGFTRNYDYGDDPLGFSSTGAIWDHVLAKGLTFRNYGEVDYPSVKGEAKYGEWLEALNKGTPLPGFTQRIPVERVRPYTSPTFPGWNLGIPDVVRADAFLKELAAFEAKGEYPSLVLVYIPNDHTSGTTAHEPTPRALVADNDLAVGRIIEGISRSRFWAETCVFVVEDDPQDGFDHVDGHRSTCLVVSPYTKRHAVVSQFYNQASVVHTIERILGVAPANQMYALAPLMTGCFESTPDLKPFAAVPSRVPLGELNPERTSLKGEDLKWAEESERLSFVKPDQADEDTLNRILWHAARGGEEYPAALAGAHGKGLTAVGLSPVGEAARKDDDDDDRLAPAKDPR
jgi:YVTN family beta-propeller protein